MHPEQPSDPDYRYAEFDGEQLAFTDEGAGAVIIALPGLPGSVRDFRWLAPALEEVRLVRVEPPGYGRSTRATVAPMDIAARADVVRRLMDVLRIDSAMLLSHSAGGLVAAELAARDTARVDAVALLASPGPRPHPVVRATRRFAGVLRSRVGRALAVPLQRPLYRLAGFSSRLSDAERTFTTLDAAAQDFDRHARNLGAMRQPTLTAWAQDDPLISADIFEALDELVPEGPRLRFDAGGHNIQKSKANEIAQAVRELQRSL